MKNIAIITARSGSKGLIDKNIKKLGDTHLIGYTIKAAIESGLFDKVYVSTDSSEYARIAIGYGATAFPLRPKNLSKDTTSSSEVIQYILNKYPKFDNFCLLQPTSPFRTEKHITEAYDIFVKKEANCVVSLVKSDKSPNIINSINEDGTIDNFLKSKSSKYARQNEINYVPNGAIFWVNSKYYKKHNDFYYKNCYPYVMDKKSSIDIDDKMDFSYAQFLFTNTKKRFYNIYDDLLEFEKKNDLYSLQYEGEYIWPYFRNKIYGMIHRKYVKPGSTNIINRKYTTYNSETLLSHNLEEVDAIVFTFNRNEFHEDGQIYDDRTSKIIEMLEKDGVKYNVVSFNEEGLLYSTRQNELRCDDINAYYEDVLVESAKNKVALIPRPLRVSLERELKQLLGVKVNLASFYTEIYAKISTYHKIFEEIYSQKKPKYIFLTSNYMRNEVIIPAKKIGIKVYEIQYAAITDYHNGYHYNNAIVPTYPDEILTWGKYWSSFESFPKNVKVDKIIGTDFKYVKKKKQKNTALIVSQNLMSTQIVIQAMDLANANPTYKFKLRIHPNEILTPFQEKQIEKIKNLKFDNGPLKKSLEESEFVLGVSSTILYEAAAVGCKIVILDGYMKEFSNYLITNNFAYTLEEYSLDYYRNQYYNDANIFFEKDNNFTISDLRAKKYNVVPKKDVLNKVLNKRYKGLIKADGAFAWFNSLNEPIVTIVIPNFNGGKLVERLLKLLSNLSNPDAYRVIFSDDCSTDSSLRIANKFVGKIKNLTILESKKPSGGPGEPRNKGIKIVDTKYTQFLDSDDLLILNNFINALYLMEKRKLDYIRLTSIVKFDRSISLFGNKRNHPNDFVKDSPFLWNGIYKTSIIKENNITIRQGIAEDHNFNVHYLTHVNKTMYYPVPLVVYYKTESSASKNFEFDNLMTAYDNHFDSLPVVLKNYSKSSQNYFVHTIFYENLYIKTGLFLKDYSDKEIKILDEKNEKMLKLLQNYNLSFDKRTIFNSQFSFLIGDPHFREDRFLFKINLKSPIDLPENISVKIGDEFIQDEYIEMELKECEKVIKVFYDEEYEIPSPRFVFMYMQHIYKGEIYKVQIISHKSNITIKIYKVTDGIKNAVKTRTIYFIINTTKRYRIYKNKIRLRMVKFKSYLKEKGIDNLFSK